MNRTKIKLFQGKILNWYKRTKRDLPWRKTKDPYKIWISEIILQQTRVDQGLSYYNNFINVFPDIASLASATENDVLKLWQGLGYYTRARNLHSSAQFIMENCNGVFPDTYNKIIELKGVGRYTAAAIASISFNEATPVVDGNVIRVFSRLFDIETPVDSSLGIKNISSKAELLLDKNNPGDFNQAVMELGAMICTPSNPNCKDCPVCVFCKAKKNQTILLRPVKIKKIKVTTRNFVYFHIIAGKNTYLVKRTQNDIWKNLYEFPMIETETNLLKTEIINNLLPVFFNNSNFNCNYEIYSGITHKLSHLLLNVTFIRAYVSLDYKTKKKDFLRIPVNKLKTFPLHILMEKYLSEKFYRFAV